MIKDFVYLAWPGLCPLSSLANRLSSLTGSLLSLARKSNILVNILKIEEKGHMNLFNSAFPSLGHITMLSTNHLVPSTFIVP
jgi:hypothetical protein